MNIRSIKPLLKATYSKWSDHHAPRLGAAVAFYALLSFAPLLVLALAATALVFGEHRAEAGLIDQARMMIGNRGADAAKSLIVNAQRPSSGLWASLIAFVTLLFGASGVFGELRDALNTIWDAEPKDESGLWGMLKQRLFSFGMVLSVGFLLLVSLVLSAAINMIDKFFGQFLPLPAVVLESLNFLVSLAIITVLFALLYKFVPARKIAWRDVRVGALGTAILFAIGKFLLGLYLGKASVGSSYGAAGSLIAVIVWVYYSAQIFFFGAEFTRVYADADLRAKNRTAASGHAQVNTDDREASPAPSESAYAMNEHKQIGPKSHVLRLGTILAGFLLIRRLATKYSKEPGPGSGMQ